MERKVSTNVAIISINVKNLNKTWRNIFINGAENLWKLLQQVSINWPNDFLGISANFRRVHLVCNITLPCVVSADPRNWEDAVRKNLYTSVFFATAGQIACLNCLHAVGEMFSYGRVFLTRRAGLYHSEQNQHSSSHGFSDIIDRKNQRLNVSSLASCCCFLMEVFFL